MGERFLAAGKSEGEYIINGIPGNALGAYLDGASIEVHGNVQDAVGDTMNDGRIVVHGSAGDALGYAMRGGEIYVEEDTGYRTGIHMKQYGDKKPVIIVGNRAGSFLGEYLAGGIIVILGLKSNANDLLGNFTGTGMHGGKIFVRTNEFHYILPSQVSVHEATEDEMLEIHEYILNFSDMFGVNQEDIKKETFFVLTPNTQNPYKRMYVAN